MSDDNDIAGRVNTALSHQDAYLSTLKEAVGDVEEIIGEEFDSRTKVRATYSEDKDRFNVEIEFPEVEEALEDRFDDTRYGVVQVENAEFQIRNPEKVLTQRDRIRSVQSLVAELEDESKDGAPIEMVYEHARMQGMEESEVEETLEKLKQKGEVYNPSRGHLMTI